MEVFWKGIGAVLVTVILGLALRKNGMETGLLLTLAGCCLVAFGALTYLKPVLDFVRELQEVGQLDSDMLRIVLKAVGIGLVGEISALICADAGNGALGKTLQLLTSSVILWLSLPLMTGLLELIQEMLGEL